MAATHKVSDAELLKVWEECGNIRETSRRPARVKKFTFIAYIYVRQGTNSVHRA